MKTNVARPPLFIATTGLLVALLLTAQAAMPTWWESRGVITSNLQPDDFAVINQGQLKNLVAGTVAEMNAKLTGGAGQDLNSLVSAWQVPSAEADDFAAANIGQLKELARLVHQRLLSAGVISILPVWATSSSSQDDNFALANQGQAKNMFSFVIPNQISAGQGGSFSGGTGTNPPPDSELPTNGDPVADDTWEKLYSGLGSRLLGLSFNTPLE